MIRVAPNLLVFDDPKLLPKVYHRYADKSDFYSAGILGSVTPPFQTKEHKEHAAKRKRIAGSVSAAVNLYSYPSGILLTFERLVPNVEFEKIGKRCRSIYRSAYRYFPKAICRDCSRY